MHHTPIRDIVAASCSLVFLFSLFSFLSVWPSHPFRVSDSGVLAILFVGTFADANLGLLPFFNPDSGDLSVKDQLLRTKYLTIRHQPVT